MTSHVESAPHTHVDSLNLPKYWYAILLLPVVLAVAFVVFQPVQVLPRIELAPGYALIDQHGDRFTNEDVRGQLTLYTITYTHCGDDCPDTSATMRALQETVAGLDLGELSTAFVSISIDPQRDTPARMAEYARDVGADGEQWRFVTGEPAQLKQIIGAGFRTYYDATGNDATGYDASDNDAADNDPNQANAIPFDPVFVLVDGWGITRAIYRTGTPDPEKIARDYSLIAREVANSTGVNRFAYEAAHLFLCYPS